MKYSVKPLWPYVLDVQSPQAYGLTAWLPGDPGGGATLYDLSGVKNNAILQNMAFTLTSGWTSGNEGGSALAFDGANDFAYIPVNTNWETPFLSCGAWVLCTAAGSNNPRFLDQDNAGATGRGFYLGRLHATGNLFFGIGDTGFQNTAVVLPLNQWHHVFVTFNGSVAVYYFDGRPVFSCSGTNLTYNGNVIGIGATHDQEANAFWYGKIEDVRLYNRGLSAAEVWAMFEPRTRWGLRYQLGKKKSFVASQRKNLSLAFGTGF